MDQTTIETRSGAPRSAGHMRETEIARIDAALGRGDYEAAAERLAVLYEQDPEAPEVVSRNADALFHLRRYDDAETMYRWLAEAGDDALARDRAEQCRALLREMSKEPPLPVAPKPIGVAGIVGIWILRLIVWGLIAAAVGLVLYVLGLLFCDIIDPQLGTELPWWALVSFGIPIVLASWFSQHEVDTGDSEERDSTSNDSAGSSPAPYEQTQWSGLHHGSSLRPSTSDPGA